MNTPTLTIPAKRRAWSAATLRRVWKPGLHAAIVDRGAIREFHLTLKTLQGERPGMLLWRLDAFLREHKAQIVKWDVFGSIAAYEETVARMQRLFGDLLWPITWVEGAACENGSIAGMQVFAVAGVEVETLVQEGRPIGRLFNDGWARHLLLGDVRPKDLARPNTIQAAEVYQAIEDALSQANMVLSEVARTWLFLDNILSWYGPFNTVRTEIFTQQHLFEKGVPASTGIGARNPAGAALVAGAWAVQPLDGPIQIREVSSPLQCTARSYGSCFSRAMELSVPGLERLLVSGTASIEPIGRSAHQGDVRRQIQLTMEVVDAILISRKLRWTDVTRATAYFKRKKDAPCFTEWCLKHRVSLPLIVTECDICRDELLFEIELDAIAAHGLGRGADWEL